MKGILKIENFGPIDSISMEVKKFNILIGPHASGKSTISKVLCIIFGLNYNAFSSHPKVLALDEIKWMLRYYKLDGYLNQESYLFFKDNRITFEFKNSSVKITRNEKYDPPGHNTYYFPAERIALPMISESLFELNLVDSSLPKFFLKFGQDFMLAKKGQKTINLPLLGVEFHYANGENRVKLKNTKTVLLEETSSAVQSNLPLLVILNQPIKNASTVVIEELELHNFPKLQKKMLSYLIECMKHSTLEDAYVMLPTHSPYLLSAANNLLFAAKVGAQDKDGANGIINEKSWISPNDFTAYFVKNGGVESIVDAETGLIHENMLDSISDELGDEFDALMELYKPVKA